jgi:cell division protein FtsA
MYHDCDLISSTNFNHVKHKIGKVFFLSFLKGNWFSKVEFKYREKNVERIYKEWLRMIHKHSKPIFALDIGTRSVVGIIVEQDEEQYKVIDYVFSEHQERSMVDGQIHDVLAVAEVIKKVKTLLEEKHGPLTKVAVAAAGRSLKTKRATVSQHIAGRPLLTRQDILAMELEAVQTSQAELAAELDSEEQTSFYCVGYSVINYSLDQETIGNLVDQRGREASVEIIATFLPRIVVDSLISALKRADLEMEALTLEPIAAINVLIPPTMRKLNVALVDIGAGTSDIAITSEGAISAYGMVPFAGDEITDALSQHYLLDFPVAEALKRKLYIDEKVEFEDILGFPHDLSSIEVVKGIQPAIQQLAEQITKELIHLNGKTPQAVMLIGGGSLTPTLTKWIAGILGLPENRVGIKGLNSNQSIQISTESELFGPEAVTPIGIAIAARKHPVKYLSVTVNQNTVRLFDLRKLTIGDALLASGLHIKRLHGKPGLALSVEVNGKIKYIPGTHGHPPLIYCNGEEVALDTSLQESDQIEIKQGTHGENAQAIVKHVIADIETLDIFLNQELYSLEPTITVNGKHASLEDELQERDQVEISVPKRIQEVLQNINWNLDRLKPQQFRYYLKKDEKWVEESGAHIWINKKIGSLNSIVNNGDKIDIHVSERKLYTVSDLIPKELTRPEQVQVTFNDQTVILLKAPYSLMKNDQTTAIEDVVQDGDHLQINNKGDGPLLYHDVFRYVEVDVHSAEKGKKMAIRVNGQPATFDTPITHGDQLELKWE